MGEVDTIRQGQGDHHPAVRAQRRRVRGWEEKGEWLNTTAGAGGRDDLISCIALVLARLTLASPQAGTEHVGFSPTMQTSRAPSAKCREVFRESHQPGGGGGGTQCVHGRSRMTTYPRIPTMPGRSISGFHQPGKHCLHQARSALRCSASRMKGELHPFKNRS